MGATELTEAQLNNERVYTLNASTRYLSLHAIRQIQSYGELESRPQVVFLRLPDRRLCSLYCWPRSAGDLLERYPQSRREHPDYSCWGPKRRHGVYGRLYYTSGA